MKKAEATNQRILDAAARMFRSKGYAATTVNDIAKLANIRAASIYYHFDSKDELFGAVLDIGINRIFEAVRSAIEAMPAQASPSDRLRMAIEVHLATLLQHGDYTAANIINFGLAPEELRARNHAHRVAYGEYWHELLVAARDAGEIRPDADLSLFRLFLIGALNWAEEWYHPGDKSVREMADECFTIFFKGVAPGRT